MKPLDQECHMLTFAGHGGIGHLDVFQTDELTGQYDARSSMPQVDARTGAGVWSALRRLALDIATEQDEDVVLDAIGPTPAVSEFVPKLVLPIQIVDGQWSGAIGGPDATPALVKLESYPGLVALEKLAYLFHRQAGIATPKSWSVALAHGIALPTTAPRAMAYRVESEQQQLERQT
jgi:serine/threonine-protein kinase HipA